MARKNTTPKPKATPSAKPKAHPKGNSRSKPAGKGGPSGAGTPSVSDPPAPVGRMKPPRTGVTVRMYRTGLGDCFLLAFPKAKTRADPRDAFYLLIDCGVFKATPNGSDRVKKIAQHIKTSTSARDDGSGESRIDVLVITHEHWDHVSGFHPSQARNVFKDIQLGTLWMAWTEDDHNALANQLRSGRRAAQQALTHALTSMHGMGAAQSETALLIRKVLDFFGGVPGLDQAEDTAGNGDAAPHPDNDRSAPEVGLGAAAMGAAAAAAGGATADAMNWLKKEYGKGKVRFLHPGDGPLPLDGVADARVYVLGPPEDATLIKRSNPTAKGDEVYPRAMAAAVEASFFAAFGVVPTKPGEIPTDDDVAEAKRVSLPFEDRYQIKFEDARKDPFFAEHYFDTTHALDWRRIEGDWLEAAGEFALALDSATNNTSLAFALEIGPAGAGHVLLFPGDAQVGNWLSWFGKVESHGQLIGKDMVWKVGNKAVDARDLLGRTVLYKVGHHGSHNATLREEGLKLMGSPDGSGGLVAMIPVDEYIAHEKAGYGDMPLPSLVKDLLIRTGGCVMRNDEGAPEDPGGGNPTLKGVPDAPARKEQFGSKHKTDLYIEYTVP